MNINDPALDKQLQKTKGSLFYQKGAGFLGPLLAQIEFRWDDSVPTAGITESVLLWNPEFFRSLDEQSRVTVLAHELWHNAYLHGVRRGDRDPETWNVAADHLINNKLRRDGYYMDGFPYLMDPKYADETKWSTDEIYDDLLQSCPPSGGGKGQPGAAGNADPDFSDGLGQDILPTSPGAKEKAIRSVVEAATIARLTNHAGDIPGEITMTIEEFLNPKLPWETLLLNWFNALCDHEYSYARPSRRYEDPLLPGLTGRNGLEHLIYAQDISGSISDEDIIRFNSELKHVQEDIAPERMTVATFDTKVRDVFEFERGEEYGGIEITGRGGTDLEDLFKFAKQQSPTALIIFTDLYVDIPPDPGFPVLWICNVPSAEAPPYGNLIFIEP